MRRNTANRPRSGGACLSSCSGIDMLVNLCWVRKRRVDRELGRLFDLAADLSVNALECRLLGQLLGNQPVRELAQRVTFTGPLLFLFARPVVAAIDVADVMTAVPV